MCLSGQEIHNSATGHLVDERKVIWSGLVVCSTFTHRLCVSLRSVWKEICFPSPKSGSGQLPFLTYYWIVSGGRKASFDLTLFFLDWFCAKWKKISSGFEPFYCVGRFFVVLRNIGLMTFTFPSQVCFYTEQKLIKTWIAGSKRNEILDQNKECYS